MDDKLFMIWFVVSFAFSEPDQTRPEYPFLGSWIGSHPPVRGSFEQFVVLLIQKRHLTDTSLSSESKLIKLIFLGAKN